MAFHALALLAGGCSWGIVDYNKAPTGEILSPADGDTFRAGESITFEASASDAEEDLEELIYAWNDDAGDPIAGDLSYDGGNVIFVIEEGLPEGSQTVHYEVLDHADEFARDEVTLEIGANTAPTITILSPEAGGRYADGLPVYVEVQIIDDDPMDEIELEWGGVASDNPDADTEPDEDGYVRFALEGLAQASFDLTVTATDPLGVDAEAGVDFSVEAGDKDGDGAVDEALGGDDCDDGNAFIYPGALELCDDVDEDCDGTIDEDPTDATAWYLDADGDGHGDPGQTVAECDQPAGTALVGDDCNDSAAAAYPGATEVCNDGVDNDCDGTSNNCGVLGTLGVTDAAATVTGEAAGDIIGGLDMGPAGDVDGDGYDDFIFGSYTNDSSGSNSGAAWIVGGPLSGTLDLGTATAELDGAPSAMAGTGVAGAGDVDGDGYDDVIVGAPYENGDAGTDSGAAYIFFGPLTGTQSVLAADVTLEGVTTFDYAGGSVATAGDMDGDGLDDVLIAALGADSGGPSAGVVYLVTDLASGTASFGSDAERFNGEASYDEAGACVRGGGDVDGDGVPDVLITSPDNDAGGDSAGALYLISGATAISMDLASATERVVGQSTFDAAGTSMDLAGDVDGDGYDDVIIGAPGHDGGGSSAGAAYILLGSGFTSGNLASAPVKFNGEEAGDAAGTSVSGIGDIDGDGLSEVIIGAPGADTNGTNAGAAYLFYGSLSGTLDLSAADARIEGLSTDQGFGTGVSGAGDMNGDSFLDVFVGAESDDSAGADAGSAWLFLGGGM